MDDRRDGIEKAQLPFTGHVQHILRQGFRGEGAGSDHHILPVLVGKCGDLLAHNRHQRVITERFGHGG